ncbi:ABC transporter transmembrane domain-containing protein [Thermosipho sp. 1244]|uniref:ABC transporter transmembrane domain-containing protein n=1 Tax=Thermosipho sp. 1244 TaxID=1755816 RepID=UPI001BDEE54C|nr:multidrug ABC transporter ATPase [Thermosipho sp. 1244]
MKEFYKYFFLFHKVLSKKLFLKKFFIDVIYVLTMLLSFVLPIFLGRIVDNFRNKKALDAFYVYALIYIVVFTLQQITQVMRRAFSLVEGPRFLFERSISSVIKRRNENFVPEKEMDKIFSFEHIFEFFYGTFSMYVFILPVMMILTVGVIILNSWKVGVIALVGFLLAGISSNKKMHKEEKIADQMNKSEYKVSEVFSDLYSGYENIKAYETFPLTFKWLSSALKNLKKAYDLFGKTEILFGLSYELGVILIMTLVIFLLGFQVFVGNLSVGKAIMLVIYIERLQSYSKVYIEDTDYISWVIARAKIAYEQYLKEDA